MSDLRDFSWTEDRDSIVLPEQPETAVYANGKGFVVIRQNGWPDDEDAVVIIDPNNVRKLVAAMFAAVGIADQASAVAPHAKPDSGVNAAMAFLKDIEPDGPLEAALAVQMLATHRVAMEQLRRSTIPEQPSEVVSMTINRANKLLATFTKQVEALSALRGKTTQQKVTVKHVHVHEGGQAIVGNVNPGDGGRGRKGGKPHASPVTYAHEPDVWSEGQDAERAPLPVASNGKR